MPEPTNHREQAEHWLAEAAKNWDSGDETGYAHSAALIAIGHALLALGHLPAETRTDTQCPWWTNGEGSWALWSGSPSVARCVRKSGHDGEHDAVLRGRTAPPPSVSEG